MAFASNPLKLPVDGRQSETALAIARGSARLLHAHGRCVVSELPLPSGRRADLVALDPVVSCGSLRSNRRLPIFVPTRSGKTIARIAIVFFSQQRSTCLVRFFRLTPG